MAHLTAQAHQGVIFVPQQPGPAEQTAPGHKKIIRIVAVQIVEPQQHARVMFIDAAHQPPIDQRGHSVAVAHVDDGYALAVAAVHHFLVTQCAQQGACAGIGHRTAGSLMLPILLVKIGITNYKWLSWAYTLNSYGLPLFFWFLALFGARKDRNIFFVVAACFGMCFFSAATLLFNPHILNYSLAAAVFVLLLRNKPINTLDALIVLLLICLQLKTYESVIFLTPLQLLFLLTRLYYDRPDRITKSILYMCLFVGLYVTYYGVASFFSSAFDATKKSAFLPLSLLLQSPNLKLTVCMLLFLFSSSLSGLVFRNARKLKFVNIVMSLLMITACLCFFASHNWGYEKPWLLVDLRIPAGYVLFTVFAALFFDRLVLQSRFLKGLALGKSWPFAVLVFCITVACQG